MHDIYLVEWRDIDYNIGNHFDGTVFTAPRTGLYTFSAQFRIEVHDDSTYAQLRVNGSLKAHSGSDNPTGRGSIPLPIQTTLKLAKDDKIEIRISGKMNICNTICSEVTYFEGRLIARIDE